MTSLTIKTTIIIRISVWCWGYNWAEEKGKKALYQEQHEQRRKRTSIEETCKVLKTTWPFFERQTHRQEYSHRMGVKDLFILLKCYLSEWKRPRKKQNRKLSGWTTNWITSKAPLSFALFLSFSLNFLILISSSLLIRECE